MQRMIKFFYEHNQRPDIAVTHSCSRIVLFELFNEPARIVNANIELIARLPQKCASQLAQFTRRFSSQDRQLRAARPIDQAIFQIDPNLCVRSLKQFLDLAEQRLVHRESDGRASSSRLSS